jgi:hypothetical protein
MEALATYCDASCKASLLVAVGIAVVCIAVLIFARMIWTCLKEMSAVLYTIAINAVSYAVISYLVVLWMDDNSETKKHFLPVLQFHVEKNYLLLKEKAATMFLRPWGLQ